MPSAVPKHSLQAERKRRVHAKSRKGCGNCKLRRVKVSASEDTQGEDTDHHECDELRPQCRKCLLYGVDCSYGGTEKSLQLSAQGSFQVDLAPSTPTEMLIDFGAVAPPSSDIQQLSQSTLGSSMLLLSTTQAIIRAGTDAFECSSATWTSRFRTPPESLPTLFNPISMVSTMTTMIDESLHVSSADMQPRSESTWFPPTSYWHFSDAHLEILARFRDRTALTIGQKDIAPSYRDLLCKLAMTVCLCRHICLDLITDRSHRTHSSCTCYLA
jgi:hypothetical protein